MGTRCMYTVRDYATGAVIAKGTSRYLEASGVVPRGQKTSSWAKVENKRKHDRQYLIEKEVYEQTRPIAKTRRINVYTCYDAKDNVLARGTARELYESGFLDNVNEAYYLYLNQKGRCARKGVARMSCEKESFSVGCADSSPGERVKEKAKAPEKPKARPRLKRIPQPTALDYDVHDLMEYNAAARKMGRPELNYGHWVAAGRPERP